MTRSTRGKLGASLFLGLVLFITGLSIKSTQPGPVANSQMMSTSPQQSSGTVEQARTLTTAVDGTVTWTYATPYGAGVVPIIEGMAQATFASTDVINLQLDGAPTNTAAKFRVTRTQQTVVALIGLTVLSIPASVGATTIHVTARAPT